MAQPPRLAGGLVYLRKLIPRLSEIVTAVVFALAEKTRLRVTEHFLPVGCSFGRRRGASPRRSVPV